MTEQLSQELLFVAAEVLAPLRIGDAVSVEVAVQLQQRIAAAILGDRNRRADGWIPVAERPPAVHEDVPILTSGAHRAFGYLDSDGSWYLYHADCEDSGFIGPELVTHWMPLPAAPKDGD